MSGFDSRKIEQLYACLDQREWKVGWATAYSQGVRLMIVLGPPSTMRRPGEPIYG